MKKRLLSLLLTVCMIATMFAGLAATANAADDKVTGYLTGYTLKAGDTIYGLCETRGIDFNANLARIGKINNITNYNYMMPGKKLWLPSNTASTGEAYYTLLAHTLVAGETPATLCQSYGIDYSANYNILAALNTNMTTFMAGQVFTLPLYIDPNGTAPAPADPTPTPAPGTTPAPTPAPAPAVIPTGDTVSYYLAQHVLQYGETVSGICAALGVNFGEQDAAIRRLNNIANYNYMMPGSIVLVPTKTVPTSGSYYKVIQHTVVGGDTVYGLCGTYGLDFGTYQTMIQRLNNRNDLTTFYPGQPLYMPQYVPAATTVVTPPAATPTPAPAATTPTPAPAGDPTPTPTPAPAGAATPTPAPANVPAADTLEYLIIPHIVQGGETVSGICAAMGIDYMTVYDRVKSLSNISDLNWVKPGTVLLVPSTVYPASGPYYKIMKHTFVAGETVWGLCEKYGLNYWDNVQFIQRLNNRNDLSGYFAGQTIYMPLYVAG